MLQMRPNGDCCEADLAPGEEGAVIGSFERASCTDSAEAECGGACPTCGGALMGRPTRAPPLLARVPAAAERKRRHGGYHATH